MDDPVAAEGHDDVEAFDARSITDLDSVTLVGGDGDLEIELAGEGLDEDVGHPGRGRGGMRVHDQQSAHSTTLIAPLWVVQMQVRPRSGTTP